MKMKEESVSTDNLKELSKKLGIPEFLLVLILNYDNPKRSRNIKR